MGHSAWGKGDFPFPAINDSMEEPKDMKAGLPIIVGPPCPDDCRDG